MIWTQVAIKAPNECWPFQGPTDSRGRGRLGEDYAHRAAYKAATGLRLQQGDRIYQRCRNHLCCNPGHLALFRRGMPLPAPRRHKPIAKQDLWAALEQLPPKGQDRTGYIRRLAATLGVSEWTVRKEWRRQTLWTSTGTIN